MKIEGEKSVNTDSLVLKKRGGGGGGAKGFKRKEKGNKSFRKSILLMGLEGGKEC